MEMYTKEESVYIWLDLFDFLSYKKKMALLSLFGSAVELWDNLFKNSKVKELLNTQELERLELSHSDEFLNMQTKGLARLGITAITTLSKDYPEKLREVSDPPYVLYCKGDISLLSKRAIAIVGSRRCTRYGREQAELFAKSLCKHGFVVISGMAEGIDTAAHVGALDADGKTIAVLAGGLSEIYPASNLALSEQIANKGLLVSEMRPNYRSERFSFPIRNRIIAALSEGVFVPEMGSKSGARYTLNYANDYGREMFVLPGPVNNFASAGSNILIKECQAACVLTPEDVLNRLGVDVVAEEVKQAKLQLNMEEQLIYNSIKDEQLHYDELIKITQLEPKMLNSLLTTMQISGLIQKLPGNFYAKGK